MRQIKKILKQILITILTLGLNFLVKFIKKYNSIENWELREIKKAEKKRKNKVKVRCH